MQQGHLNHSLFIADKQELAWRYTTETQREHQCALLHYNFFSQDETYQFGELVKSDCSASKRAACFIFIGDGKVSGENIHSISIFFNIS
jgi:hypothetical protein